MSEIVVRKDTDISLERILSDEIAVYDDELFEINVFSQASKDIENLQKRVFYGVLAGSPVIAGVVKNLREKETFKIVLSQEATEKIKSGVYKFMKGDGADGLFRAIVVDANGKVIEIPHIEEITNIIDPAQIAQAMQGMAIQMKLKEITEQLEGISTCLNEVLAGQHNDRLAKYYTGVSIYKEALALSDDNLRKRLIEMAILILSEAYSELAVTLKYDIDFLCSHYSKEKGRFVHVKPEDVCLKMAKINSAFQTIHKAVTLKSAIYFREGEYQAAVTSLSDYGKYIERVLPEGTTGILRNADLNEKSSYGIWGERSLELPNKINEMIIKINDRDNYCLEYGRGSYEQIQMY